MAQDRTRAALVLAVLFPTAAEPSVRTLTAQDDTAKLSSSQCLQLQQDNGVIPGTTFGTLPDWQKRLWHDSGCDDVVAQSRDLNATSGNVTSVNASAASAAVAQQQQQQPQASSPPAKTSHPAAAPPPFDTGATHSSSPPPLAPLVSPPITPVPSARMHIFGATETSNVASMTLSIHGGGGLLSKDAKLEYTEATSTWEGGQLMIQGPKVSFVGLEGIDSTSVPSAHYHTLWPKAVWGNHRHTKKTALIMVWGGEALWRIERPDTPLDHHCLTMRSDLVAADDTCRAKFVEYKIDAQNRTMIEAPPGIAHAVKNLGSAELKIVSLGSTLEGQNDAEESVFPVWQDFYTA